MPAKSHHTAVVLIPPQDLWEPIQAIRSKYDRQVVRWMPHINLLYPFAPRDAWHELLPPLTAACASIEPFAIQLASFGEFVHPSGRVTLYLVPEPPEPIVKLQRALQAAAPEFDDLGAFTTGFTPHLSVGQADSREAAKTLIEHWISTWQPLAFAVSIVSIIRRWAEEPFAVERIIPLGQVGDH